MAVISKQPVVLLFIITLMSILPLPTQCQEYEVEGVEEGEGVTVGGNNTAMFSWRPSPWSACEFRNPGGCCQCVRRRTVDCVWRGPHGTAEEEVVPPFYCRKLTPVHPPAEEPCFPCHQPCVLSLWGDWSPCSHTCGHLGTRNRLRTILVLPTDTDASVDTGADKAFSVEERCGPLMEAQVCSNQVECEDGRPRYSWKIGPWTSCRKVNSSRSCGNGQRTRQVQCLETDSGVVANDFCKYFIEGVAPESRVSCSLPCDCRVESWTEWGPCSVTCHDPHSSQRPLQTRTRTVRRQQQNGGLGCPSLIETKLCDVSKLQTCTRHTWHVGKWSACRMQDEEAECGSGVQERTVTCKKADESSEEPVSDLLCLHDSSRHVNGSVSLRPVSSQACEVECPRDCQLGEWQNWSGCTQSCGEGGLRIRTKPVLMEATRGGEECTDHYETKPCDPVPCSWWHTGRWSTCFLDDDSIIDGCGAGQKVRNVYCLSSLDEVLLDEHCTGSVKPVTEQDCRVPCEDDCVVSDWSEWGPCSTTCGPQGGLQYRTRTAHIAGSPERSCLPASELEQSRICNQKPCRQYLWQVSAWSECERLDAWVSYNVTVCTNETQLPGIQTRTVRCEMDPGYQVNSSMCDPDAMPETERECAAPCPQDCELSSWSDWSRCSHTCGRHSSKVRLRNVLKLALYGGQPCPENKNGVVMQKKKCKRTMECHSYEWVHGRWGECETVDGCGMGIQSRNVTCVRSDYKKVKDSFCQDHVAGMPPVMEQQCVIPCEGDCALTEWSTFTPCSHTCGKKPGFRTRTRQLLHLDKHDDAFHLCPHITQDDMIETVSCGAILCPEYRWVEGPWGSCIVHNTLSRESSFHCGTGVQRRHVLCLREDGVHVARHFCDVVGPIPPHHLECHIPCTVDCEVTEWTDWTNCSAQCGNGTRTRRRQIVQLEENGGRQCPHLVETQTCMLLDCEALNWVMSEWEPCSPTYGLPCGNGKQQRTVICPAGPAFEDSCHQRAPKPISQRPCDVPCYGDCKVGNWSEFSSCDCQFGNETQIRTREVLEEPVPSGEACPELEEVKPCDCFTYQVLVGEWTSCYVKNSRRNQCGKGTRERVVNCVRSDGMYVSLDWCELDDLQLSEPCEVECPLDCELSRLTHWSKCAPECGLDAVKTRWQSPMTRPNQLGRQCPPEEALVQNTTCHSSPCYTYSWLRGEWEPCSVPQHQCGLGTRVRSLDCQRSDGTLVDSRFCLVTETSRESLPSSLAALPQNLKSDLDLEIEQTCGAPCPGDCLMSAWSEWGPCFHQCEEVNLTMEQVRTRTILKPELGGEPCPEKFIETRACEEQKDPVCPVFIWETSEWEDDGQRQVSCQLLGMMTVEGGCVHSEKPSHNKTCNSTCGEFAACVEGKCRCSQGFQGDGVTCLPVYGCELNSHCIANQTTCNIYNKECQCEDGNMPTEDLQCVMTSIQSQGYSSGLSTLILYILIGSLCALMIIVILCILCLARKKSKQKQEKMDLYTPNLAKIENLDNHRRNNELHGDAPLMQKYSINSKNLTDDLNKGPRYTTNFRTFSDHSKGNDAPSMNGTLKSLNKQRLRLLAEDDKDHDYVPMFGTTPDRSSKDPLPPPPSRSHSFDDPLPPPPPPPPMKVSPRVYEPLPPPPDEEPHPIPTVVHVPSRSSPARSDTPRLSTFKPDSHSSYSSGSTSSSSARSSLSDLSIGGVSARNSLQQGETENQTAPSEGKVGTPQKKHSPPPFSPVVTQAPHMSSFKPHMRVTPPREGVGVKTSAASSPTSSPGREARNNNTITKQSGQLMDYCDELIAELENMAQS